MVGFCQSKAIRIVGPNLVFQQEIYDHSCIIVEEYEVFERSMGVLVGLYGVCQAGCVCVCLVS